MLFQGWVSHFVLMLRIFTVFQLFLLCYSAGKTILPSGVHLPNKTYQEVIPSPQTSARRKSNAGYAAAGRKPSVLTPFLDDPRHILLNETQTADFLGLTKRTLRQPHYCSMPPQYIKPLGSNTIRYRLSDLMDFVAAGEMPLP